MTKLASFSHDARHSFGVVDGSRVIDMGLRFADRFPDLKSVMELDAIADLSRRIPDLPPDFDLDDITFERPIRFPEKIFCAKHGDDGSSDVTLTTRVPGSLVGHLSPLCRPPESALMWCTAGIAVVIGRRGRRISKQQASHYIAGVTLINDTIVCKDADGSAPCELYRRNFDRSGAIGPWIVPVTGERSAHHPAFNSEIEMSVNGQPVHKSPLPTWRSIDTVLSHVSTFTTLKPGDIIAFGATPIDVDTDAGAVTPGDRVDITVDAIGTLSNTIVDE